MEIRRNLDGEVVFGETSAEHRHQLAKWKASRTLYLAALLILAFSPSILAQQKPPQETGGEPAEAPEPIITEETMPNDPGEYTFRWNFAYSSAAGKTTGALPEFQFFFGITDRIGGEISIPFVYKAGGPSAYGIGDVSASIKGVLVKEGRVLPGIVAGAEVDFPTGNPLKDTGEGAYQVSPFAALLKRFGRFSVQGNTGWTRNIDANRSSGGHEYFYNWALSAQPRGKRLYLFAEINGIWGNADHQNTLLLAPGFRYQVTEGFSLGFALPIGLNRQTVRIGFVDQVQLGVR